MGDADALGQFVLANSGASDEIHDLRVARPPGRK
jgi:hypothetical protein